MALRPLAPKAPKPAPLAPLAPLASALPVLPAAPRHNVTAGLDTLRAASLAGVAGVIADAPGGLANIQRRRDRIAAQAAALQAAADKASAVRGVTVDPPFTGHAAPALDTVQNERVSAIAGALVDTLSASAALAASRAVHTPSSQAADAVWRDVLDLLAGDGLEPVIYCARSGRLLAALDPAPWADWLAGVARLGQTRSADAALSRLYGALLVSMGQTVAPAMLQSGPDALALLREVAPIDYLLHNLAALVPMAGRGHGLRADSLDMARRAQMVARWRRDAAALPRSVVEYACEVSALYLAYINPALIPARYRLGAYYPGPDALPGALGSVASVGHLCGRLMQSIVSLICDKRAKPLTELTRADLLALKTSYHGLPGYGLHKTLRRAIRADLGGQDSRVAHKLAAINFDLATGAAALDFGYVTDLVDMQTALAVSGRAVPVRLATQAQAQSLQAMRAAQIEAGPDDMGGALDLGAIALFDMLPDDFVADIDMTGPEDFISAGWLTFDEAAEAMQAETDSAADIGLDADIDFPALEDTSPAFGWHEADKAQAAILADAIASSRALSAPLAPIRRK